jgi:ABC-type multidrug transport system fused ATPase/permease subunit
MIILSQTHNLYWLLLTRLQVYLVNTLMAAEDGTEEDLWLPSRKETAMMWATIYVVPFGLLHLIDYLEVQLKLTNEAQQLLQNALFCTYLTYTTESRSGVRASDINLSLLSDIPEMVHCGFIAITPFLRFIGKLAVVAYFIMQRNPKLSWVLVLWPSLLVAFIAFRYKTLMAIGDEKDEDKKKVRNFVTEVTDDFDLIGPYHTRPQMALMFRNLIKKFQEGRVREGTEELHNHYFSPWLGTLFIGAYVAFGSSAVFDKQLSLGDFLTTIHVFKDVGGECKEMYKRIYDLCMSTGALGDTIDRLNADSNCKRWVKRNEESRQLVRNHCKTLTAATGSASIDELPLSLKSVNFKYQPEREYVFQNVQIDIKQGKLVAIIGDMHAGKTTFAKLIGELLLLQEGQLDVPSHLHVLLVEQRPFILESLSCFENMSFGTAHNEPDQSVLWRTVERVADRMDEIRSVPIVKEMLKNEKSAYDAIQSTTDPEAYNVDSKKCCACCRPNKSEHLEHMTGNDMLNLLESSGENLDWVDQLSLVDRFIFSLARAFVHNPEVLIVDRPMRWFESVARRNQMFTLFREFVDNRGLGLDKQAAPFARPRTCIMTLSVWFPKVRLCDEVWHLKKDGIYRLSPEEIEERIEQEMAKKYTRMPRKVRLDQGLSL